MSTTPVANNEAEVTQNNDSTDLKTVSPKDTPDPASTESVESSSSSTQDQTSGEDKKEDEMSMAYLCKGLNQEHLMNLLTLIQGEYPGALDLVKSHVWEHKDRCKCFIRNLNFTTTDETLRAAFQVFGPVAEVVVLRNPDGTSKGYGFVVFENLDGAETAVSSCRPSINIDGRQVNVYLSNDQQQQQQAGKTHHVRHGGNHQSGQVFSPRSPLANQAFQRAAPQLDQRRLFVRGLAWSVDDQSLRRAFEVFGPVEDAAVIRFPDGRSKGFGFVVFARPDHAQVAVTHPPSAIDGRSINVHMAAERNPVQGRPIAPQPQHQNHNQNHQNGHHHQRQSGPHPHQRSSQQSNGLLQSHHVLVPGMQNLSMHQMPQAQTYQPQKPFGTPPRGNQRSPQQNFR